MFFTHSLDRQLNKHLLFGPSAVPSLEAVENEGLQSLNQDLPWRELFKRNQSLGSRLTVNFWLEKGLSSRLCLNKASRVIQQQGQTRT